MGVGKRVATRYSVARIIVGKDDVGRNFIGGSGLVARIVRGRGGGHIRQGEVSFERERQQAVSNNAR